jgi:hypothetical protein
LIDEVERIRNGILAKVKFLFQVVKCQFGYAGVTPPDWRENTAQLTTHLC